MYDNIIKAAALKLYFYTKYVIDAFLLINCTSLLIIVFSITREILIFGCLDRPTQKVFTSTKHHSSDETIPFIIDMNLEACCFKVQVNPLSHIFFTYLLIKDQNRTGKLANFAYSIIRRYNHFYCENDPKNEKRCNAFHPNPTENRSQIAVFNLNRRIIYFVIFCRVFYIHFFT
jgi:hypothetical protein